MVPLYDAFFICFVDGVFRENICLCVSKVIHIFVLKTMIIYLLLQIGMRHRENGFMSILSTVKATKAKIIGSLFCGIHDCKQLPKASVFRKRYESWDLSCPLFKYMRKQNY